LTLTFSEFKNSGRKCSGRTHKRIAVTVSIFLYFYDDEKFYEVRLFAIKIHFKSFLRRFPFWTNAATMFPRQESLDAQSFTKFLLDDVDLQLFLHWNELKRRTLNAGLLDGTHPAWTWPKYLNDERTKDQGSKNQKKPTDTWKLKRNVVAQNGGYDDMTVWRTHQYLIHSMYF
jgi:hypothetical protein